MKRTFGVLLMLAVLSTGALALAGDTSTTSDGCPPSCEPCPSACPAPCPEPCGPGACGN